MNFFPFENRKAVFVYVSKTITIFTVNPFSIEDRKAIFIYMTQTFTISS